MSELHANLQNARHVIGERDYALERSFRRPITQWPLNIAYGLNSFEFFQGLNNFVLRIFRSFNGAFNSPYKSNPESTYIETSLYHTRYRNYHDKII